MKNIFNLYILRLRLTIKSAVLVIPTVIILFFISAMYSVIPVQVSGSFLISGLAVFIVCAFVAMSIQLKENDVHEQIIQFHSKSATEYYISRELLIYSISLIYSIILIVYPIIKRMFLPNLFRRPLKAEDIIYGGLLIIGSGFSGIAVGDLFHHRIIATKRNALIGLLFLIILSLCKQPLIKHFSFLKILHVLVPPITDGLYMVGNGDFFNHLGTTLIFIHMIIYVIVIVLIKIKILMHKKYMV